MFGTITCGDIRQTKRFSAKPSAWRATARFLAHNVDGWGTPWEADWCGESPVLEPYQMDVILLCWLRYEGEEDSKWGNLVLSLPDSWLEAAHARYGNLIPNLEKPSDLDAEMIGDLGGPGSWETELYLLDIALGDDDNFSDVVKNLSATISDNSPCQVVQLLFNRYREFMSYADRIEKEIEITMKSSHSFNEYMVSRANIDFQLSRHLTHFLRTGSVPNVGDMK
jgi:hypothetical protein